MPSTSVHFPVELLARLDRAAAVGHVSRNKLVIQACEQYLDSRTPSWPDGFFAPDRLTDDELAELRAGADELLAGVIASRRNRISVLFE